MQWISVMDGHSIGDQCIYENNMITISVTFVKRMILMVKMILIGNKKKKKSEQITDGNFGSLFSVILSSDDWFVYNPCIFLVMKLIFLQP